MYLFLRKSISNTEGVSQSDNRLSFDSQIESERGFSSQLDRLPWSSTVRRHSAWSENVRRKRILSVCLLPFLFLLSFFCVHETRCYITRIQSKRNKERNFGRYTHGGLAFLFWRWCPWLGSQDEFVLPNR